MNFVLVKNVRKIQERNKRTVLKAQARYSKNIRSIFNSKNVFLGFFHQWKMKHQDQNKVVA